MFALSLLSVNLFFCYYYYFLIWFPVTYSVSAKCPLGLRLKRIPLGEVVVSPLCFSWAVVLESGLS